MKKECNKNITLSTENQEFNLPLCIVEEERKHDKKTTLKLVFNGKTYESVGNDMDWSDAFANLQKKLPKGIFIKCCMSCQYGNLCPYGAIPGTILCTFPEKIQDKLDLVDLLGANKETARDTTYFCENFKLANEDFYTYNDFYYYLTH